MSAWKEASTPAKVITFFMIVFLVSLGLCGLNRFRGLGDMQAAVIELLLMSVSVVGVVITLIVALISATVTGRGSRPQTLFGSEDEKSKAPPAPDKDAR
jgi:hypothetical protein